MRSKSGTIRIIDSFHRLEKLQSYSMIDFGGTPFDDGENALTPTRPAG